MSRDDYISKLFIDNEHKLDETPSDSLWDRLEAKLDKELPVKEAHSSDQLAQVKGGRVRASGKTSFLRFAPYMAAASVLILVVTIAAIMKVDNDQSSQVLAENMDSVEDVILEEPQPIITSADELNKQFEKEDKKQEEKIIETVKRVAPPKAAERVASLDDVELKESESKDVILIEPEITAEELALEEAVIEVPIADVEVEDEYASKLAEEDLPPTRQLVKPQDFKYSNSAYGEDYNNRAYGVPPSADPSLAKNLKKIEETASKNTIPSAKMKEENYAASRRGLRSRKADKKAKSRKPYEIHPRIRIFDWMLGDFQDKSLDQGKSIESWRLLNPNTIEGVGVLMKGKDKIFEEKMLIVHDPTQNRVFLKMYVDESRQQLTYILTNFDTERIVFEQLDNKNYPNKVIFQRLMNGFSTIIQQDNGFIQEQQQRYLNHRNNVSNVRAVRDLEAMN